MSPPDPIMLLAQRRWALPIIAEVHRRQGAKFITLCHELAAAPGAVRPAVDLLIGAGWLAKNPGYGHPLRPEYILTPAGERLGDRFRALDEAIARKGLREVALRRWSLPVLRAVDGFSPARFTQIVRSLDPATDRAVSLALKDLAGARLIGRELEEGYPPAPLYRLSPAARPLAEMMALVA